MKCDDVITLKQYGGTCWFNAILTAIIYSDESRKLLLEKSKTWDTSINIFNTLSFILKNKYFRTTEKEDDYKYFEEMRPEKMLVDLNKYDSNTFTFNPLKLNEGYHHTMYIQKVYKLLGVNILYLDYNYQTNKYYYSRYNTTDEIIYRKSLRRTYKYSDTKNKIDEIIKNHDIIIIKVLTKRIIDFELKKNPYPEHYLITDKIINNVDDITFKNQKYNQDSVILSNFNKFTAGIGGHAITGIKCMGVKHVYNGWARSTIDPSLAREIIKEKGKIQIPCEYMRFEWKTDKPHKFILNPKTCSLDDIPKKNRTIAFSFNDGERVMIYTKVIKNNPPIVLPEVKVVEPVFIEVKIPDALPDGTSVRAATTLQAIIRRRLTQSLPKPEPVPTVSTVKPVKTKICKEGSTLNTETNRCNKNCTEIQEKNPATGRCRKLCTDIQIRNPETGRCKKIKEPKAPKILKPTVPTPKVVPTVPTSKVVPTVKKVPSSKNETPEDIIIKSYDDPNFPIIFYQQAQGNKINSILEIIDKLINKNFFINIPDLFKSNKRIIKTIFDKLYNKSGKAKDVILSIDYIQNLIIDLIIYVSGDEKYKVKKEVEYLLYLGTYNLIPSITPKLLNEVRNYFKK